jgi:hypothetical protein
MTQATYERTMWRLRVAIRLLTVAHFTGESCTLTRSIR